MQCLHEVRSLDIVSEFHWSTVTFWLTWNYSMNFLYVHSISSLSLLTLSCQYIILYRDFPLLWIPGDWSIKNDRTASIDSSSCISNSSSISSSTISYLFKNMWHIQVTDIPFMYWKFWLCGSYKSIGLPCILDIVIICCLSNTIMNSANMYQWLSKLSILCIISVNMQ